MPVNGWEFILLIVLAFIILGPQRMPEYAAKFARLIVQLRRMARDAKGQLKEQMGPEYDDLDWRQYDPRQYDPRRIVKQALLEPLEDAFSIDDEPASRAEPAEVDPDETTSSDASDSTDGASMTPWDREAT